MAKKAWIKNAIKHKGALHRHLGVKPDEKIPEEKLHEAANSKNPTIRKEASLAMTLKGMHHGKKEKNKEHKTKTHSTLMSKMYHGKKG